MPPKGQLRRVAIGVCAAVPLLLGGFVLGRRSAQDGFRVFRSVLEVLATEGIDGISPDSLYKLSARGLVAALDDPYAELFSRDEFERYSRNSLGNRYGGIGLRITRSLGAISVWRVIPGGPAEAAGVRRGDRIEEVDGASTDGWAVDQASGNLTGVPGTTVRVTFGRPRTGERYTVDIVRAVISVSSVPFAVVLEDGVGYIPLQRFSDHSASDVADAVRRLRASGARSLVLDLRDNPGGSLEQSIGIADLFLPRGRPVVRVLSRRQDDTLRTSGPAAVPADMPLTVLVDSQSASASEIIAGALQDHDRALIVGTVTFGKGLVQGAYTLPEGWVFRLTTGRWYTPSGRLIQRTPADSARTERPAYRSAGGRTVLGGGGITPDIITFGDTVSAAGQAIGRILNQRAQVTSDVLDGYAFELEPAIRPDFVVQATWRSELLGRLRAAGFAIPDTLAQRGQAYLDRVLEVRLAGLALSDSTAFRRSSARDVQLARAVELMRQARSQADLYAAAGGAARRR